MGAIICDHCLDYSGDWYDTGTQLLCPTCHAAHQASEVAA